ncbi:uncharacterized protein [Hoplias malabaricus]|uniref:uncharacterized protein n=1 Tax=Hoplias malabaricus TaxID=27720 RepID=UPI003462C37E
MCGCCFALWPHSSFSNSLRLTRTTRARVQQLFAQYKEQQLGDSLFEMRRLVLKTLPSVTLKYHTWIQMQDTERLSLASHDLYIFSTHLEGLRKKLEQEGDGVRAMQRRDKRGRPQLTLTQSMKGIQLDLRDLLKQVNTQMSRMKTSEMSSTTDYTSTPTPTSAFSSPTQATPTVQAPQNSEEPSEQEATSFQTSQISTSTSRSIPSVPGAHSTLSLILTSTPWDMDKTSVTSTEEASSSEAVTQTSVSTVESKLTTAASSPSRWVSRLEGYVILRDLERYLSRLARDFSLLKAKY